MKTRTVIVAIASKKKFDLAKEAETTVIHKGKKVMVHETWTYTSQPDVFGAEVSDT